MMLEFFCRFLQFLLICFFSCALNKKSKIKVEHIVNNLGFSHSTYIKPQMMNFD